MCKLKVDENDLDEESDEEEESDMENDHDIVENKNENELDDNECEKVHDLAAKKYTCAKCNFVLRQKYFF